MPSPSTPVRPDPGAFARRVRSRETVVGYWVVLDAPPATERIARIGYDYVAIDAQHGLLDYRGVLTGLLAVDAGGSAGVVRVAANDPTAIGQALDAGARGLIVPLVNSAADAAAAVAAAKYPPFGVRSYGPMRSGLRIGPVPAEADEQTAVLAMIETAAGLAAVEEIAATPGLDGLYVGPSDLAINIGGAYPGDPAVKADFDAALERVLAAAAGAGIAAGIHTPHGSVARERLAEGWTFVTVASDVVHLETIARDHLGTARGEQR
ncbi:HpcH/HpaI aldolase/citrate lyase family protein [Kineococcus gynurae]|uniref:HpcH/HpaI aldolase/citrate lyase family protein n=1 Tax=Kineococcus gynurae TaxID=452979 RepID=A0ABV5LP22_9ACTN